MVNVYEEELAKEIAHPYNEWIVEHLQTLHDMTVALNAQSIIECGVQSGQSSKAFLAGLSHTGGKLWSCDIDPLHPRLHLTKSYSPNWTFTQANDLDIVADAPMADIIFIDTNHEYEHTFWELFKFRVKLNEGGIFILHDTFNLDCLGVFAAAMYLAYEFEYEFYNYHYCSGLGILGKDLSKVSHLFNNRGYKWH